MIEMEFNADDENNKLSMASLNSLTVLGRDGSGSTTGYFGVLVIGILLC